MSLPGRTKLVLVALATLLAFVAVNLVTGAWSHGPANQPAYAASTDYFLKVDGIKGESRDKQHADEIDISTFNFGAASTFSGLGGGGGKVNCQDLTFRKQLDLSSPQLLEALYKGTHIKDATLTGRRAGKEQLEFLVIKIEDVVVNSYKAEASGGNPPVDTVSLAYTKVNFKYTPQKADGSGGSSKQTTFDCKQNKSS